jgi:hypothetical protein
MNFTDAIFVSAGQLLAYVVLAAAIGMAARYYKSLRLEMRLQQERWIKRQQSIEAEVGRLRSAITELRASVADTEQKASIMTPPAPPGSGFNLTHRGQAIRMYRRGERPEQIAAALSLPLNEVELLLKVHVAATESLPAAAELAPNA